MAVSLNSSYFLAYPTELDLELTTILDLYPTQEVQISKDSIYAVAAESVEIYSKSGVLQDTLRFSTYSIDTIAVGPTIALGTPKGVLLDSGVLIQLPLKEKIISLIWNSDSLLVQQHSALSIIKEQTVVLHHQFHTYFVDSLPCLGYFMCLSNYSLLLIGLGGETLEVENPFPEVKTLSVNGNLMVAAEKTRLLHYSLEKMTMISQWDIGFEINSCRYGEFSLERCNLILLTGAGDS